MKEVYRYTIYGEPAAQKRARFSSFGGRFGHVYDASKADKQAVIRELMMKGPKIIPINRAFELTTIVRKCFPKSTPKKELIDGAPCVKKPDIDNYLKFYLDCLTQAGVIEDDRFCFSEATIKVYTTGDTPSVTLIINTI